MSVVERALRALALEGLRLRNRHRPPPGLLGMYPSGPVLLGHRGARDHALENTLPGLGLALALGADGVELDVHLSADAVPVVVHDETVDRTMRGSGEVARLHSDALERLAPRRGTDPRYAPALEPPWSDAPRGVPRLAAVLERMPDDAIVNVELKGPTPKALGLEARVLEAMAPHRERLKLIVSSFHPAQLLAVRELDATVPIGVLVEPEQNALLRSGLAALALRPEAFHPPSSMVTRELVKQAHRAGMRVHVWGVKDAADGRRLLDLGADALIVDDVPGLAALYERTPRFATAVSPVTTGAPRRRTGRGRRARSAGAAAFPPRGGPVGL